MERALGNAAASESAYAEALRVFPGYENGYFGLGLAREALGDLKGAETAYRNGLSRHPRSLPLAYRLALLLSSRGRPEALFAWRRALAIEPRSAAAQRGLRQWTLSGRAGPAEAP
jgi:tetratricopeptide (TPR) repeat protein